MSEPTTEFDAKQALTRVSEVIGSAAGKSGGKGKNLKPGDQRQVVQGLNELLVRTTLPLAEIANGVQGVPSRLYADALGEAWSTLTSERRNDAIQWIEGLPRDAANSIRRLLIPVIAEKDPRSARLILPAKPKVLDSAEERERFAKNWLGRGIGPFENLLAGELVEYEVTRVLRLLLRLAGEPAVTSHIRSQAIRATAQALVDNNLTEAKTGLEPIFHGLAELITALPSVEASAVSDHLCDRTPSVASRLSLKLRIQNSSPKEAVVLNTQSVLPTLESRGELPDLRIPAVESAVSIQAGELDQPGSPPQARERGVSTAKRRDRSVPSEKHEQDTALISALETRALEHRESALFLERAASRLKASATTIAALETTIAALEKDGDVHDEQRETLEDRIESLRKDLINKDDQLRVRTDQLRSKEEAIRDLERSNDGLSAQLLDARTSASTAQSRMDEMAASHKSELETLLQRVAGQTDQRLDEFRNDLARRVSEILRGTPPLDSDGSAVDGKAVLFRLWEIVEALKRKSIPIRNE
jgi:hypothetical protein